MQVFADEKYLLGVHFHYDAGNYCFILDIDHSNLDPERQSQVLWEHLLEFKEMFGYQEMLWSGFTCLFLAFLSWNLYNASWDWWNEVVDDETKKNVGFNL